ncbi:MAG: undecaprenyldiphospho-muramoylpentapeptide beta-N-acetylglucosaminyltransferase [Clostridia bacterium]|nr:undecaprenyldiphospho-muramoylpentapeptide beta-N-acetylglucosaminyltransferase [Clostridia bacterium]MBO4886655.1 undecaprenyldiphospho-muramoylpentapeptide beta-N-acetylglucosaminyltransferase [Clostridia bacterium]
MKKIILTGGGTAGHVTPNLALIPSLRAEGWEIHYIGTENGIERRLIEAVDGVTYHVVKSGKLRRYFDLKNFTDPFRVIQGAFQAGALVKKIQPDIVFSKGGFVSVPVVYGARMAGVPVLLHESDMSPGLANKITAPFAKALCCTFPEAAAAAGRKGRVTGTPLRAELFNGDRETGIRLFGLTDSRPVLMVVGGSSGAQAINKALRAALGPLTECFQVLHLCGQGNLDPEMEGTKRYHQYEYLDSEMSHAYACADVLISRAGSNTLCEILALHKPALLIPYPKDASRGDQILNARSFEQRGLARVLMQEDMTPDTLTSAVIDTYKDRGQLIDDMEREPSADGVANIMQLIHQYAKKN